MTLALDPSSPAVRASGFLGASPESWASNSFSPPAGSVITVICWAADSFHGDWGSNPTITDSLGSHLAWTLAAAAFSNALSTTSQRVSLFWAPCPSAQTGMTVTVTEQTPGQQVTRMAVSAEVWTGAAAGGPIGATAVVGASAAGNSVSQSLTPTTAGSALLIAGGNQVGGTGTVTAGSGCFLTDNLASSQVGGQAWLGTSGGPSLTAGLTPQTLGLANTGSANAWQYIAYEVLPAVTPSSGPAYTAFMSSM